MKELSNEENIKKTKQLIKEKKTIFEAGVVFKDYFFKTDILTGLLKTSILQKE